MRVLAADDDASVRRVLDRTLKAWGYDVELATSGAEAWRILKRDAPPIVVLDWDMPGMSGIEVCRLLRSTAHGPQTYVLILTGKQQKEDLIEALEAGADDFLSKPFHPRELQLRLAKGVRDRHAGPPSSAPPESDSPAAGVTIGGKFRLERTLGQGGMGTVWLGVHLALGINVAIKVMRPHVCDDADYASFDREARAAAQLRNEHAVRVFDHGIAAEGVPYLVMEYLSGESLWTRIERVGALPPGQVMSIVGQTADALADAHARGIVHRDVKPDNILLIEEADAGEEPFVKLVDFGLALRADAATRSELLAGTPAYMSPECLTGDPADAMLDLWGLACTAFHAMTGVEPFADGSAEEIYLRLRHDPLPIPSRVADGVPPGFDAWFARACAHNRENRFATAGELASALRAIHVAAA